MLKPRKTITEENIFFRVNGSSYEMRDVIAELPAKVTLNDVLVEYDDCLNVTIFSYRKEVENLEYEAQRMRYVKWRDARIAELRKELVKLEVED